MHERKVTHFGRCPDSRVVSITLIVVSFALFSVFLLGTAVVANKAGEGAWPYRPVVFLPGILALVKFGIAFRSCDPKRRRQFWRSVLATAFAFAGIFAAIEIGLRWCAVSSELGERIGTTELLPHEWQHVRRVNLELLRQFEDENAFFVEDAVLGWDVGKGRETGAYASSAEGIRSASPAERYSLSASRPRIALVGDSFTFGEEVAFEETWGRYLEPLVNAQVLNFGVTSHGLDQTLLKFKHKVKAWSPKLVVLGMLDAAAPRSGNVYLFLRPDQRLPFSKPRFVEQGSDIEVLNSPVVSARELYASRSPFDLEFVDHDVLFQRSQWQRPLLDASLGIRFLLSRFPRWDPRRAELSDAALDMLSARIIKKLDQDVKASGGRLFVVYLPERAQIRGGTAKHRDAIARSLGVAGIAVFDPTACLLARVNASELFVESGVHYSAKGNRALAACLAPELAPLLAD